MVPSMTMPVTRTERESVDYDLESETRFAVVMYGGVSLAIYIHGAAQELYHMVRATARVSNGEYYRFRSDELSGTEKVYRALGKTLKTKFVVDILSGTSAGGINAVYLAKALANDLPMDIIKDFWINNADISMLINDKGSLNGLSGLSLQNPPLGLLSSQRFYYKLLEALMAMGSGDPKISSPYVSELDLNITATDIRGLDLPLFVNNTNVNELRYKNVFQFYYRPGSSENDMNPRNDFAKNMDPFLAFAARCTASIPPAFEAMQLKDIAPVLKTARFKSYYQNIKISEESWKKIYKEYENEGDDFTIRAFGDGGYLDNKPFSYATEALLRRRADVPVDRRLIYIEPSPEHPEDQPFLTERPDMIQNVLAALVDLPRKETIREDLERIKTRNELVRRIKHILVGSSGGSFWLPKQTKSAQSKKGIKWSSQYLMDKAVLDQYGMSYISYHQLRMENVLRNLSTCFARAVGWNEGGEEEQKIHLLLHRWLDQAYSVEDKNKKSQNEILYQLDLSYRMRRHHFMQTLLNIMIDGVSSYMRGVEDRSSADLQKIFDAAGKTLGKPEVPNREQAASKFIRLISLLKERINDTYAYSRTRAYWIRREGLVDQLETLDEPAKKDLAEYVSALATLKDRIQEIGIPELENEKESQPEEMQNLIGAVEEIKEALARYLRDTFERIRVDDSKNGLRIETGTTRAPLSVEELVKFQALDATEGKKQTALQKKMLGVYQTFFSEVQDCLEHYYRNFEYYDMLIFPITYGTDAGESDEVEVIRISPDDATGLVNERQAGVKKLAGTTLANFGAFFKKEWRENDMMWGRLDAAEIMIGQLLKDKDYENDPELIATLQKLYEEEFANKPVDQLELARFTEPKDLPYNLSYQFILEDDLRPRLTSTAAGILSGSENWLVKAVKNASVLTPLVNISNALIAKGKLLAYFKTNYMVERKFPPQTLNVASRASTVTGNLLDDVFSKYPYLTGIRGPIKSLSSLGTGLLMAAQGDSLTSVVAGVIYIASLLLILGGWLIPNFKDAMPVGLLALIVTLIAHVSAMRIRITFSGEINVFGRVVLGIFALLWGLVSALFWVAVALLFYLGFVHLGLLSLPNNIIGRWIEALVGVFTAR